MSQISVTDELAGHRLDFAVSRELGVSRAYAQSLIRGGHVASPCGRGIKPSISVELGEVYEIDAPQPEKLGLVPEPVPFDVVFSDQDIIVIDKPAGLVVHPAPGHWSGTLVHGLLHRFPELGNLNGVERPGIVHRLDATTSGLMVVARSGLAQEKLWKQFKSRTVGKSYIALCFGAPRRAAARIDMPIGRDPSNRRRMAVTDGGRDAVTDYAVLWSAKGYSLVRCVLHSGRTHQIRVHMNAIGCPLVGDLLYAPSKKSPFAGQDGQSRQRVFLHSWRLSLAHPRTGEPMSFRSPLPDDLKNFLVEIRRL
ncbi:MAG: RluA family pseudouridine synthase [Synergistaceae bacterium]|jgi:23S rRNA pseudouridine1911/1915/1917 synthase|nr:RluA family pseudouridine synthase [Synergistaceae bacterium]